MIRITYTLFVLIITGLPACMSTRVATVWKAEPATPISYHHIMVAGVVDQNDDSLRAHVETIIANSLSELGYYAGSSLREFGPYGLKALNEEATYLTLCDNGIDAVLTFALVEESYGKTLEKGTGAKYTNTYYYNRLWNYRKLQAQKTADHPGKKKYKWEVILFDLATLQPQAVMQSRSLSEADAMKSIDIIASRFIKQLLHEKVIAKQNTSGLKPF